MYQTLDLKVSDQLDYWSLFTFLNVISRCDEDSYKQNKLN